MHSRLKIPIEIDETSTCNISLRSNLCELIRHARILIWDKCSIAHRYIIEAVDRSFKDIMRPMNLEAHTRPFGGKLMLFDGDFRQVLPIVKLGSRASIVNACVNRSTLWTHVKVLRLTKNMHVDRLHGIAAREH